MISFKKSYAEQLLQLALALSLLRVDPNNYLGWGWESQLALNNGDGWQLELRAAPLTDYPYANRKAMMPLIEDLVRFDRHTNDVTAYLLNSVHSSDTQEVTITSQSSDQNTTANNNSTTLMSDEQLLSNDTNNTEFDEFFMNSAHFQDSMSVFDQNLADLSDYGEIPLSSYPYMGIPLKDEPPELSDELPRIEIKRERASTSFTSDFESMGSPAESNLDETIEWEEYCEMKREIKEEGEQDLFSADEGIKTEKSDEETKSSTLKEDASENSTSIITATVELTLEESELIEVLWKQDVDLGFTLTSPAATLPKEAASTSEDDVEKLKALLELKNDKLEDEEKVDELGDAWAGLPIDAETGEYIQQLPLQLDDTLLEEALHDLADLTDDPDTEDSISETKSESITNSNSSDSGIQSVSSKVGGEDKELKPLLGREVGGELIPSSESSLAAGIDDTNELEELLCDMMIQTSSAPFQHPRSVPSYGHGPNSFRQSSYHHQSRVPLSRTVSMEQRWQDLANLLSLSPGMGVGMGVGVGEMAPHPHYPSHYSYQSATPIPQHTQFSHHPHSHPHPHPHPAVLHNASLADLGPSQPHYGPNLGSAVASSMHLTNSSTETDGGAAGYKMDHDLMYYSNTSSELNHTTDGFLNSILNDEDLQLMDMGVNEGMYITRMLDHNTTSSNSSVLGGAAGGSHAGGGASGNLLTPSSMQTNIGSIGAIGSHAGGGDRLDASSDSAVSSMGSERVPSLSDGEWGDAGSDSAQEYHQSKYGGPYDYSYSSRLVGDPARQPPVAQKKHHMFAKRYFQEQNTVPNLAQQPVPAQAAEQQVPGSIKYEYDSYGMAPSVGVPHMEGAVGPIINQKHQAATQLIQSEMKYSCSLDFARQTRGMHDLVNHNHTYTLPQGSGAIPRPQARDKKQKKIEDEHLTRDEKRAKALGIPMPVHDIINLPMDEFNERLSKYELSETQLSLIRDIRRRGKNKVAAQNCRKRKLDQILSLADEVKEVRKRKDRLQNERESALAEQKRVMDKFTALYRHVFQYLRDPDGNPYSSSQYSLQQSADGSVYLLPREHKADANGGNMTNQHHSSGGPHNSHHQKE